MKSEEDKGEIEINVFRTFLKLSKLPIDPKTVEKRFPPEPDIFCRTTKGENLAFELVEICDSNLARAINNESDQYIRTSDPSLTILKRKLAKTYNTPYEVELLAYVSGRVVTPDDCIIPSVKPVICNDDHSFKRVWLLGESDCYLLWEKS